ncbi:DinB family protein [Xanthobacter autotrophicus]|uniref:DinB family protein n=1 Tax=Xanthobacter autotrophicus TaxID=280 RepID=UPI0024A623EE|nr:DinB family protein [Xanthobacter autotrophicus]MDI4655751.1 DinB family protein [Xanthobacter autotrophicus]
MPLRSYTTFAAYNAWANARLYAAARAQGEDACGRPAGAFFGSVSATLNHLVVADRIWLARFEGKAPPALKLDTILAPRIADLEPLRTAEDARIIAFTAAQDALSLSAEISYANSSGQTFRQSLASALDHFFNHQAHHRGQAHALLTSIGGREAAPSLDLIVFQREQAGA